MKVLIVLFTKGGSDYGELFAFREFSPKIREHLKIVQAGLCGQYKRIRQKKY